MGPMGRPRRVDLGGYVYHVLNRANAGMQIFESDQGYLAFEKVLAEAVQRAKMRLLAYCLMPNHWHLVVWPRQDGDLSRFVGWLTLTHTQRWHASRHETTAGHLYQGRYKSFLVDRDDYFLSLCCYVERNGARAALVDRAEQWRWCSLWRRLHPQIVQDVAGLSDWPVPSPKNWLQRVNQAETSEQLQALQRSVNRGQPYGRPSWVERTVNQLDLHATLRPRGRPRSRHSPAVGSSKVVQITDQEAPAGD